MLVNGTGFFGVDVWGHYFKSIDSEHTIVTNINQPPPTVIPIVAIFENNVFAPFHLEVDLTASAFLKDFDTTNFLGGSATAIADFGHTFTWGGITSVTDAETGEPINNWTLTSQSGTDWAHPFPVPEPTTFVPLILAAVGSCLHRRRAV